MAKSFTLSGNGNTPHIDFAGELNAEQLAVVKGADGYSLVLAGAGSGKTRTIVYRVAYLLRSGVPADQILLLTFTNKAAREMLSRVEYVLGSYPSRLTGGTFHSVANMLLRRFAPSLGYTSGFSILDQEDSRDLLNVCIKDAGIDTKGKRFPSASVVQSIWSFSRNARKSFETVVEESHERLLPEVERMRSVVDLYESRKKASNAMDFDDLLVHFANLLETNPSVRERISGQYKYVLVDEYQDTNRVQAELLTHLSSVHKNLLVVGDDAQSIYSFRAADIQNILGFPERFADAKIFKLETNYRSTPQILSLANESIKWNANQFPKELRPVASKLEASHSKLNEKPNIVAASSPDEEAQFIAEMILKLRDEGVPLSEMAVLFRATFHSQTLEFELAKRDIPYDYRGGVRFFERAHVKDVLAFLKITVNIADEVSWLRILRIQTGIGTETAARIFQSVRGAESLGSAIDTAVISGERPKVGWKDFAATAEVVLRAGDNAAEAIRAILKSPYGDYLDNEYPNAEERREDLEQLALFAEKYNSAGSFIAEASLNEGFDAERQAEDKEDETEKIVLSTIHQAKGLEWNTVFIIHLFDGAFPNQRAALEENGMEEERRLFYVAATRAKRHLFLTYPLISSRGNYGGGDYLHQLSPFLRELPGECYDQMELRRETTVFREYEEDAIELDENGEPKQKDWRNKSFLRDI